VTDPRQVAELIARTSYGRLVAWLARRCGDLALAEDAMGAALSAALVTWPRDGVPANPDGWLLTTARRRVIDQVRRSGTRDRGVEQIRAEAERMVEAREPGAFPDRRLALMLVCAHPALPATMHTPLVLQTVLGLTAEQIGSAMAVRPATIAQRLVRVKRQIRELGLDFEEPGPEELAARLPVLLDAIYAAFGTGWADLHLDTASTGLAEEARWLALLVANATQHPEALGLLALISLSQARRDARRDEGGNFVPLEDQDPRRWDPEPILEGEKALWAAGRAGEPGPYQLEAAIQSVHVHRRISGRTDWVAICGLYGLLVRDHPSLGACIGYAAALGRVGRADDGLAVLAGLASETVQTHQPFHAVKAWLLAAVGRDAEAREAYRRAAGLAQDPAVRRWLGQRARPGSA